MDGHYQLWQVGSRPSDLGGVSRRGAGDYMMGGAAEGASVVWPASVQCDAVLSLST